MSGLEVLGAIAAGVGLAQLCVDAARRISASCSDSKVSETIRKECEAIVNEVDRHMLLMMSESRAAAQDLRNTLEEIRSRIEKEQKKKRLKWSGKLRLSISSQEHKETMLLALHQYQTCVAISGNAAVEDIRKRVSPNGISKDMHRMMIPMIENLVNRFDCDC